MTTTQTTEHFSFVVQGPVHPERTKQCLESIRKYHPESEIIFSTWRGSNLEGLEYDILVENSDPGNCLATQPGFPEVYNNINRQIVSTRNGFLKASHTYAVKMRSDCILTKTLRKPSRFPRKKKYSLLKEPITILNTYTRNPLARPVLFHYSDLFMIGLLSDLLQYWDIPLTAEPKFSHWMQDKRQPDITVYPEARFLYRCTPEQYLGESFAKSLLKSRILKHPASGSISMLFISLGVLSNNFEVVKASSIGLDIPQKMKAHEDHFDLIQDADDSLLQDFRKPRLPISSYLKVLCLCIGARCSHSQTIARLKQSIKASLGLR